MNITIKSREDNAVFSVYMRAQYAKQPISDDLEMHLVTATEWTAKLSESGEYAVVVGGTRGNANYTLDIQIK